MKTKLTLFIFLPLLLCAGTFRIEAEKLAGAWRLNQASAAVGSRFCSVTKKGTPLNGSFTLPESGRYQVWVRTFDFGEKYRKTTITIGGQTVGTFGDSAPHAVHAKPVFYWNKAPELITLKAGKIAVKAVSAGGYARLDSIILTTDLKFVPTENAREMAKIRELLPLAETVKTSRQRLPEPKGKGPHVLLLSGGRPWTGNDAAALLRHGGCRVTLLDSVYLDGFGGASTKVFLSDLKEPPKLDGITPAFDNLKAYRLVIFNAIPAPLLEKMLTPGRIARLKTYIENGGRVLFNRNAPRSLKALLPVTFGRMMKMDPAMTVERPAGNAFSCLPVKWPSNAAYRQAELVPGAKAYSFLLSPDGGNKNVFFASRKIGKGYSFFWNADWVRLNGTVQLYNWAYGKTLWVSAAAAAGEMKLDAARTLFKPQPEVPRRRLNEVTIDVREPVFSLAPVKTKAAVKGQTVIFANKVELN